MGYLCDYDKTVAKLKSGKKLSENEIATLVFEGIEVDEIRGSSGRWTQSIRTIININGELWEIDWQRCLTEYQENEFYNQPYRVEKREKQIIVAEYVAVEE